ncbi:MAG: putative PurR-regulated permease PerM [Patescibacteria group bacterium]|jgi:predicted PurR-regulated permease PerM
MNRMVVNNWLVLGLFLILVILSFLVVKPILIALSFGMILAYVFNPLYIKMQKNIKNPTVAAAVLIIVIGLLIILPLLFFTPIFIQQIFGVFDDIKSVNIAKAIVAVFPFIGDDTVAFSLLSNLNNMPGKFISSLVDGLLSMVLNFPNILLQTFVFLFTFFFALRDSDKLVAYFKQLSPFSTLTENRFMREFRVITNSVILGQVLIGLLQGLSLGLGMLLLGVPNVLIWTILTVIVSIIPVIGPWLVWVPLTLFLFVSGDTTSGVILALYSGLFVSNIDNVVRPYLLSRNSKTHLAINLAGTIGGLYFMGILGLILGPLILAYFFIIVDFYRQGKLDELYRDYHAPKPGLRSYELNK